MSFYTGRQYSEDDSASDTMYTAIIEQYMASHLSKYCTFAHLNVFTGTFNVNGRDPPPSLNSFLADNLQTPPDIYAIGFQELDLNPAAFILDISDKKEELWLPVIQQSLHPGAKYKYKCGIRTVGIWLVVFVKTTLLDKVTGVETHRVNTGQMNLGNKGGVSVRLNVQDTSICFVNCHLAAGDGDDSFTQRNDDFMRICNKLDFPQSATSIFDHDILFWMGDLNYRLQTSKNGTTLDILTVKRKCQLGDLEGLMCFDQLKAMQKSKRSRHHEFDEGDITFLPTYKYDTGTDQWDSSEKLRVPSWCDRILWIDKNKATNVSEYMSIPLIKISDHKPVRAIFNTRYNHKNPEKYNDFKRKAINEATKLENEALPNIKITPIEFKFGKVSFLSPKVQYLELENIGRFIVHCEFKKPPTKDKICKDWLVISPESLKIPPGEKASVTIQILIDKDSAEELNTTETTEMSDILVLHLAGGRDYFPNIAAEYCRTCFATLIEVLVKKEEDAEQPLISFDSPDVPSKPQNLRVPKQMWRMVEYLKTKDLKSTCLFGGSHKDFDVIRDALDNDLPFPESDSTQLSVMEALTIFLDSLPRKVIPQSYLPRIYAVANSFPNNIPHFSCNQEIDLLTDVHAQTFRYMIKFAQKILIANQGASNEISHGQETSAITLKDIYTQFSYLLFPRWDLEKDPRISIARGENIFKFVKSCVQFDSSCKSSVAIDRICQFCQVYNT